MSTNREEDDVNSDPNPISNVSTYTIRTASYVGDCETVEWFLRRHSVYLNEYLESEKYDDDDEYEHVDEMDLRSDPNAKDPTTSRTSLHISCLVEVV